MIRTEQVRTENGKKEKHRHTKKIMMYEKYFFQVIAVPKRLCSVASVDRLTLRIFCTS